MGRPFRIQPTSALPDISKGLFDMVTKKIAASLAAGALSLTLATVAHAATVFPIGSSSNFFITSGTPTSPSITAIFFNSFTSSTSFDDEYTFTIPQNGVGSGSISTSFSGASNTLVISQLIIDGVSYPVSSSSSGQSATVGNIPIHNGVLNTIEVIGSTTGAGNYSGTATFTAVVPEPATWAMMITGLGLLGMTLRRRRDSLTFA